MDKITRFIFILVALIVTCPGTATADGEFRMTDQLEQAYDLIIHLQFDQAADILESVKLSDPDNLLVYHIENYIDFFKVFISEDKANLDAFEENLEKRLDKIREGDESSPYYLFSQAEIQLQWALARSKFDQYIRAGWDINRAYKLLNKNTEKFPEWTLNKKSLALIHALVGSVKGVKRGLIKIFTSLDGSIEQGVSEINQLYQDTDTDTHIFRKEILVIRALMALHIEDRPDDAFEIMRDPLLQNDNSPLLDFVSATVAIRSGHALEGENILTRSRPSSGYPFHFLEYMKGRSKLNQLDPGAKLHLMRFINQYRGLNYIKEACQKMAWYEWIINEDSLAYHQWMDRCKHEGQALIGEDEQALQEALRNNLPQRNLLKARLLFDGNAYERSLEELGLIDPQQLTKDDFLEYRYRLGRNYQMLGQWRRALKHFGYAIQHGHQSESYFACNGALQVARILNDHVSCEQALKYIEICLSLKPAEHRKSLHQKALLLKERMTSKPSPCLSS